MKTTILAIIAALSLTVSAGAKRPPKPTPSPTPYTGTPVTLPGTIAPETYDNGGEGVAYHDIDSTNNGGAFRSGGVDLEAASFGGYDIGWTADGEWVNYTAQVATAGQYVVTIAVASPYNSGWVHVTGSAPIAVPNTGGWQTWTSVDLPVSMAAGRQNFRLYIDTGGFNVGTITVHTAVAPPTTCQDPAATNYGGPLPCTYPPPAGGVWRVPAGGDLQAAINGARPGDTILLAAGATFTGNFTLPAKNGTLDILIATDATLPAAGAQVTPAMATRMAKITSGNSSTALATQPYASHYRIQFIEFLPNSGGYGEIISLGDGSTAQNSLAMVPRDLTLDQVYVHGNDVTGQKRCVGLNSGNTTITNSRIENCWWAGTDSQAIAGWNGPGPYLIDNNYLEAASENFLLGGADPAIQNLIPSDITFTHNYLTKRMAWYGTTDRNIKNIFELKSGQRLHVEGNVFENNWLQAQAGYAIVLTGRSQDGAAPWNVVQDVLFVNNVIRNVASAINILGKDYRFVSGISHNIEFRNNLFENITTAFGGDGRWVMLNNGYDFRFDHNTVLQNGSSAVYVADNPVQQFVLTNNIFDGGEYGIMGGGTSPGGGTISAWLPNSTILRNALTTPYPSLYPAGNFYLSSLSEVGFVKYVPMTGGNYRLASTSIYRGAGTDGKDLGADIDAINAAARTAY